MNFTKYATALALFATAAYAADDKTAETTKKVDLVDTKPVDLLKAFKECKGVESNSTEELLINCMKEKQIPVNVATKAVKDLSAKELTKLADADAEAVIAAVNKDITDSAAATNASVEGKWYDCINNTTGYVVGSLIALGLIGGGVYMAVGRKSEDADL